MMVKVFINYMEEDIKNLRIVNNLHTEIDKLIDKSSDFLQNMLMPNGRYIYGYFPHFDKTINFITYLDTLPQRMH